MYNVRQEDYTNLMEDHVNGFHVDRVEMGYCTVLTLRVYTLYHQIHERSRCAGESNR